MPDLRDLKFIQHEKLEHARPGLEHGVVADTAVNFSDPVRVILPEFDNDTMWGPCRWQSRNSVDKPQQGDDCLVAFSNRREPWIVAWWPFTGWDY